MELFIHIVGFPGYFISNHGRVFSNRTSVRGKMGMRSSKKRFLRQYSSGKNRNYMCVTLSVDGVVSRRKVAHLVAEAFIGDRPAGFDVDHIDRNTLNNRASNIRYLSASKNRSRSNG